MFEICKWKGIYATAVSQWFVGLRADTQTETQEMKNMGMIENMRDAVEINGGRLSEERYLEEVLRLTESEGGSTTIASLKSNAFNSKRMESAGITRVSIGADKMVWTVSLAEDMMNGNTSTLQTNFVQRDTSQDFNTDEGCFYGVPRRSPSDYPDFLQQYIIPRGTLQYEESDRNEMRLFAVAFKNGWNVAIDGAKGCGKTMGIRAFASEVGMPVLRVNCSEGFTEESFIGYNTLKNGEMTWIDGMLPIAMRYGCLLIFDEFRSARPEIMTAWNAVGDSGQLLLTDNNNEVVSAHADFRTFATMNPLDGYSGGQDINQATLDRFDLNMKVDYLPEEKEIKVICQQSGVNNIALARQLVSFSNDLRRMKKEGTLESDTSTRMLVAMMEASLDFNMTEMVEFVMLGRYQPHEIDEIKAVARARLSDY